MERQMTEVNGLSGESREYADQIYHRLYTHDLMAGDLGRSDVSYPVLSSDGACWRRIYINESSFLAVADRLLKANGLISSYRWSNNIQSIEIVSVEPVFTSLKERYLEDADRLRVLTLLDDIELDDLLNTYPNAGQNVTLAYTSEKK